MIKLENVTKTYPGMTDPAVRDVSFEVPEGETCVIIGPSGCGKTTTLKMVNRLIEPTGGRIYVAGENVLHQDPVELRRNIGYVIQQIGLFPHMTIRDNIALVPNLLGWDAARIDQRVDELLDMMSMEPGTFRSRYPRELSGGQRQRIGVARALAADPPVMLMDEPFGAIDPINRENLQNEFLRLQRKIKKTIMFVTHDIDEAIKMGTRVCILHVGGIIAQYGPPDEILSNPAGEFVADFVGADRGLKRLNLVRAETVMETDIVKVHGPDKTDSIAANLEAAGLSTAWVVDEADRLVGYVTLDEARSKPGVRADLVKREMPAETEPEATLKDAFSEMLTNNLITLPVLDEEGRLLGIVRAETIQELIRTVEEA
jgi:osmoprotectant transport system ATP-binding protein